MSNERETKFRLPVIAVILILVLIGFICFKMFTYTTRADEYAVRYQFGKIVSIESEPGLKTKTPFIQNVKKIKKPSRLYDLAASEVITSDKKTMIIDAFVVWSITDPRTFTTTLNASDATAQSRLDTIVFNAIKTTVSSMTQDEVIASRNNATQNIEVVEADLEDVTLQESDAKETAEATQVISISNKLLSAIGSQCDQYGIEISNIEIKILDLPEENKNAVYNRMCTERKNIATAYTAQGKADAQKIKNDTDKQVSIILSEADAKAAETIAQGEAEYMKILADAYNDPEKADFYLYTMQLDTLKESLKKNRNDNVLIIDANSPFASLFNGITR